MKLREYRRKIGKSMKQVGKAVGLSEAQISRIERGVSQPSPKAVRRIAEWSLDAVRYEDFQ